MESASVTTRVQTQSQLINTDLLQSFDVEQFQSKQPFPWQGLQQFLTPQGFQSLYDNFPTLSLFEKHQGIKRAYGQRPHNRYYLAYESSIYHSKEDDSGIVKLEDLPKIWQQFLEELESNQTYKEFIRRVFDVTEFRVRYAWHVGTTHSEVSPHVDSPDKIGTHILYFNTSQDWDPTWGGSILVLDGKLVAERNPDFSDFSAVTPSSIINNSSFLFKNTPQGWHGVQPLQCPQDKYRRLFNIIFEFPGERTAPLSLIDQKASLVSHWRSRSRRLLKRISKRF